MIEVHRPIRTDLNHNPRLLKLKRKLARKNLAEVARAAGCSTGYLSQLENGIHSCSLDLLERLAEAIRCEHTDCAYTDLLSDELRRAVGLDAPGLLSAEDKKAS